MRGRQRWLVMAGLVAGAACTGYRLLRRNRSAAEARRERDFGRAVLDTAGVLAIVFDRAGRIIVFNRVCEEITGLSADEVIGQPFWDALAPDVPALRAGLSAITPEAFPNSYETDWLATDGRRRRIAWRNTALTDGHGRVTHVIGTGLDITDQLRTQRLLADVLAAATELAVVGLDADGTVTFFNAGAERLLGYRTSEVVGRATPALWLHPDELAARSAQFGVDGGPAVLLPDGSTYTSEWTVVRRDGEHVPAEVTTSRLRGDYSGEPGYLTVIRDIAQQRRAIEAMRQALARETAAAERLRELERVRGDIVATVSHELRTPLTSILGNTEMLVDGDAGVLNEPQAKLLAAVERNARRLLALIEDLLMLSRIESGAVKINARPVAVGAVVGGALEALHTVRAARGVALDVHLPPEPLEVLGDPGQLERVVINLVDNGLKFTPPGGQVSVRVDGDERYARLTVADTGIGIPADEVEHVFDQFFRSTRSVERATSGSGLGLAITKSIVERHGGRIWARAGEPVGTVVTCLLPRP